jgi:hypothetical protein
MPATTGIEWPVPGASGARWRARAFGERLEDLEPDLHCSPPPLATTAVLAGCLSGADGPVSAAQAWAWTVNRRLQGLLAVTVATRGGRWTSTAHCAQCDKPMDLPLDLRDFARDEDPSHVRCELDGGRLLEVAIATGADQLAWLQAGVGEAGPQELLRCLLARQGADAEAEALPPAWIDAVDAAMAQADPLTALELDTVCPECGAAMRIALDLERACLGLLAAQQPRLLDDVHRLALAYHWTEAEILALPASRRRQYLQRLERTWS